VAPAALIAIVVASMLVGCNSGRGPLPARPTRSLAPTIISLVTKVDQDGSPVVLTLASGDRIDFEGIGGEREVYRRGNLEPGDLLLAGPGNPADWYALLSPTSTVRTGSSKPDPACWAINGGAFEDGDFIDFSNGLRLPKAAGFSVVDDYIEDPFPARGSDEFCVNQEGQVTSLVYIFLPY